ncbi:MAG TPA: carbohydrate-binding protein [Bacteroidales bacterium]
MRHSFSLFKLLYAVLLLAVTTSAQAQIENTRADQAYDGHQKAFLVKAVQNGRSRIYYVDGLATNQRGRAYFFGEALDIHNDEDVYLRTYDPAVKMQITKLLSDFVYQDKADWMWVNLADDLAWATLAFFNGYECTGNISHLNQALYGFNLIYDKQWDPVEGGIWYSRDDQVTSGKGPLGLSPNVIAACYAYKFTGDVSYLNKAKAIYQWTRAHLWEQSTGVVWGSTDPNNGNPNDMRTAVFNNGAFGGAANFLYQLTGERHYFDDAKKTFERVITNMTSINGVLTGSRGGTENAEYIRYLGDYVRQNYLWNTRCSSTDTYYSWLKKNADAAWNTRRTDYNISWNSWTQNTPTDNTLSCQETCSSVVIQQVTPVVQSIPDTIEAEDYNFMSGISRDTCLEGGSAIHSMEAGDWIEYIIQVPSTGFYKITYRVSGTSEGSVSILQNGDTLTTTSLSGTGEWKDVVTTVSLTKGVQSIKLMFDAAGWSLNKWSAASCDPIVPYISVNDAAAKNISVVTVDAGDTLLFSPQSSEGTWSWSGPEGFSTDTREVSIQNIQIIQGGIYKATCIGQDGSVRFQNFIVTINDSPQTEIIPNIRINYGEWQPLDTITMNAGGVLTIAPEPADGVWSWKGPNLFTSTSRLITFSNINTKQAGKYTATHYATNGSKSTRSFVIILTGSDPCSSTIEPYVTVNGGGWHSANYAILNIGGSLTVGPHPSDGTWKWTGPNGFSSNNREFTISNFQEAQSGYYTATYKNSAGYTSTAQFIIGVDGCSQTSILPEILIEGVPADRLDSITVASGASLSITPPAVEGIWSLTFPNGYVASDKRELSFDKILNKKEGTYTFTYINETGCVSKHSVTIDVIGDDYCSTTIIPYVSVNDGVWEQSAAPSLKSGGKVSFGPQPNIKGTWRWTGPNGFTSDTREFILSNVTVSQAGIYTATHRNISGGTSYMNFTVTVDGITGFDVIEEANAELRVYPNPATDQVTLTGISANTTITVWDLSGHVWSRTSLSDVTEAVQINVSNLKSGIFFITLQNDDTKTFKVIKK